MADETLHMQAFTILDRDGPEALAAWEDGLTPEQRQQMVDEWQSFTDALAALAEACRGGLTARA